MWNIWSMHYAFIINPHPLLTVPLKKEFASFIITYIVFNDYVIWYNLGGVPDNELITTAVQGSLVCLAPPVILGQQLLLARCLHHDSFSCA